MTKYIYEYIILLISVTIFAIYEYRVLTDVEYTTHMLTIYANNTLQGGLKIMGSLVVGTEKNISIDNIRTFDERARELELQKKAEEDARKRAKQSPYGNWYQFNREHSKEMIWLAGKYPKAHQILLFLLDQMDDYNAVMCSYQVFQEALEISKQTITRSIKVLKDKGFLAVLKSGTSNVYIVNDDLAWGSWAVNKPYCKFPANIILSATENQEYILEKNKIKQISIKDEVE